MRPGREIDTQIATEIFGHKVWISDGIVMESSEAGERPLRCYSREMEWAWQVAEKMKISLLPVENGNWFAFAGPQDQDGWPSPNAMLETLESKRFDTCGAAVGPDAALAICEAALSAVTKRKARARHVERPDDLPPNVTPINPNPDMH
jgi:hypothetical protein